ncbi:MAG: hypothetical protein H7Y33_14000, partial [Cytophagales bacterium]|nr:hypothetical protein [Rhizobacter sp.]
AYREAKEGSAAGAWAYGVSGLLGIAATVLLALGSTGWGLIVVIALIGWSFVMTQLVDNKVEDWLERSVWGSLPRQRYGNLATEETEFKKALAG